MKKRIFATMAAGLIALTAAGIAGCDNKPQTENRTYSVVAPDGAPALALAGAMAATQENGDKFECTVVDSSTIQTYVSGDRAADFVIMPLNAASKMLGTGEKYTMLGTVTNGNMYFVTKSGETLTSENIESLEGKTVGVVQLKNVPGLTLRVVLESYGVSYRIIDSENPDKSEEKVNLKAVEATDVTPAGDCDYYLCPEPAATTKIIKTEGKLKMAGDLQALYGEGGYPQAVAVVKNDTPDSAIKTFTKYLENAEEYLASADYEEVNALLAAHRTEGLAASFNALNAQTIANCSVRFSSATACKDKVNAFIEKLIKIDSSSAKTLSDEFFYND